MNNFFTKILFISISFLFGSLVEVRSQNFNVSALIDIPGENIEFDVLSPQQGMPLTNTFTYICWVNKLDSIYTVYLKQISPVVGDNIIVSSDTNTKSRPRIAGYGQEIKVVWQNKEDTWQVYLRYYSANKLTSSFLILDSLITDPQITLSYSRIAWIEQGNLFLKGFSTGLSDRVLIDSVCCKSPELLKYDSYNYSQLLYEKDYSDSIKVKLVTYNEYGNPKFEYTSLSNGLISRNPKFGLFAEIAFQTYENNIWKCEYEESSYSHSFFKTQNTKCNYVNPVLFTYPIPVTSGKNPTLFFLAFDSDSIPSNNEIFLNTYFYSTHDSLINISKSAGDDFGPKVAYLFSNDSIFISIIWGHKQNGKTDIWIAKDVFNPITGNIDNAKTTAQSFDLQQNYPNPFNPSTVIRFSIPKDETVTLDVYNSLGQKVCELLNGKYNSGTHEVKWNAQSFASGIYFCRLVSAGKQITKKIVLMK